MTSGTSRRGAPGPGTPIRYPLRVWRFAARSRSGVLGLMGIQRELQNLSPSSFGVPQRGQYTSLTYTTAYGGDLSYIARYCGDWHRQGLS